MDYQNFTRLIDETVSGNGDVKSLQEFIREFPYFQTAHALLAKAMHDRQDVRYQRQLKIASAYAGDRKALYNLLHGRHASGIFSETSVTPAVEETVAVSEPEKIFETTSEATSPIQDVAEERTVARENAFVAPVDFHHEDEEESDEMQPAATNIPDDPHEVIRKRLSEILGTAPEPEIPPADHTAVNINRPAEEEVFKFNEEETHHEDTEVESASLVEAEKSQTEQTEPPEAATEFQTYVRPEPEPPESEPIEVEEESKDVQAEEYLLRRAEMEYAMETSILQSIEKLPPVTGNLAAEEVHDESDRVVSPASFTDWLKRKQVSKFGKVEVVRDEEPGVREIEPDPGLNPVKSPPAATQNTSREAPSPEALIEKFIRTEPKIVPKKAEFYSPANQAKLSVTEDEDLVSETLAGIYYKQGHLLKARSAYQKLSLFHPEKKAYFAALIEEIDSHLNNPDKQDL